MAWYTQLFVGHGSAQSIVALSLAVVVGLALGQIRMCGIRLGVGGVLFSGLAISYLGIKIEPTILEFIREFGLILCVFTVGMQVGPSFVDSLRRRGLVLNLAAALVVVFGVGAAVLVYYLFDIPASVAVGLFSGAVTNTPSLAAASQAFEEIGPDSAVLAIMDAGTAYAVAYPFGIFGVILVMLSIKICFRIRPEEELWQLEGFFKKQHPPLQTATYIVRNPNIIGMTLGDFLEQYGTDIVFSRVREPDEQLFSHAAEPEITIKPDMLMHGVGLQRSLDRMRGLIGPYSDEDLHNAPGPLEIRRLLVTKNAVAGKSVQALGLTPETGVTVTRIMRADVEFANRPGLVLHYGDKLTCVGERKDLDRAASIVGNSAKDLEHPQILPLFLGILLGVIIGSIPFAVPGLPSGLKLGLAGGPLLVAIFLSRMNHFAGMVWYMPFGANLIVREIGIALFMACVGLNAGDRFVAALLDGSGFRWMAAGALITFLPLCTAAFLMRVFLRYDYATMCGFLAGCMTNPAALMFSVQTLGSDAPASVYASVYPLTMVLRILCAQALVFGLYYAATP